MRMPNGSGETPAVDSEDALVAHLRTLMQLQQWAEMNTSSQDPDLYERFEKVILVHGVRTVAELAYEDVIARQLPADAFLGPAVREKLIYFPTVTREPFRHQGRLTTLVESGQLSRAIGLPALDPAVDRAMICGSPQMLKDCCAMLDQRGFRASCHIGDPGDYVIERAFVDK